MRIILKVAAIALLLFALVPALAAGAQDCATDPYCVDSGDEDAGSSDSGGGGQADTGGSGTGDSDDPVAGESNRPAGGPVTAPSGALPITGSDVVGMATIGAVAIALGALLVRRSKVARQEA